MSGCSLVCSFIPSTSSLSSVRSSSGRSWGHSIPCLAGLICSSPSSTEIHTTLSLPGNVLLAYLPAQPILAAQTTVYRVFQVKKKAADPIDHTCPTAPNCSYIYWSIDGEKSMCSKCILNLAQANGTTLNCILNLDRKMGQPCHTYILCIWKGICSAVLWLLQKCGFWKAVRQRLKIFFVLSWHVVIPHRSNITAWTIYQKITTKRMTYVLWLYGTDTRNFMKHSSPLEIITIIAALIFGQIIY